MMRPTLGRPAISALATAILLLAAVVATSLAADDPEEHAVVGRWSMTSEAGGAVWAFQPSGKLIVTGPGEIMSEGTWTPAAGERELDAVVDVIVTDQELAILGQVSPDVASIALYVTATDATRPDDWTPWPAESRLEGQRFGMMTEETPEPTVPPLECARPEWVDDAVDWDRCDDDPLTAP